LVAADVPRGYPRDWSSTKDDECKLCNDVELGATGVRLQGAGGGLAEGRMADVGMVCP
jgi:hypothetical protein